MNIFRYVFMAFMLVLSVQNIIHAIRAVVIGKKANILKVWVTPFVIVQLVLCAFWIVIAANRFSVAADYRAKAAMYEQIAGINIPSGTGSSNGYQHVAVKTSDAQTRLLEQVRKLRESADVLYNIAWYMLILGIFEFTLSLNMVWFFTAEGVVLGKFKFPEPIAAEYRDGKINVYYKAQLANNKKIKTFKATPKNMAVFGRFIVWDDPNAVSVQPPNMFS
ncbi:MAG: hypothetical protein K2J80_02865 [Oscillospiraceae bacterium]|nr:hypothetical protein [Oscillospiraceae bacterium]